MGTEERQRTRGSARALFVTALAEANSKHMQFQDAIPSSGDWAKIAKINSYFDFREFAVGRVRGRGDDFDY
jgi:hypothetical protein